MKLFFERLVFNYPDIVKTFAIPMIIGIFAFAFPLIFQVISRIDDKYDSTLFIKVFRNECARKSFKYVLVGALFSCVVWILQIPRCVDWGERINSLIDNSALILLVLSTIVLVISIFGVVKVMYDYYVPELLFNRLNNKYKKSKEKNKPMFFLAISKVMHYAIKKSNIDLFVSIYQFFSKEFSAIRKSKMNEDGSYPEEYYTVIKETNEIVFTNTQKGTSFFDKSDMFSLLINESPDVIISERTYNELWYGIRQALYYGHEDFIISYWQKAHQYMELRLKVIAPKLDENSNVINQSDINKGENERKRFLEFHDALGGLLMMKKKHLLIQQLIFWTNQTPPKYVLVPETMEEVIQRFMHVESKYPIYYEQKYPFPDVFEAFANDVIKMWIKRYLAILFLRQYILNKHFIYSQSLEMPNPPQTLAEKKRWCEQLKILKRFVNEYLGNQHILEALGLESLGMPNWFENNDKKEPNTLIDEFISCIAGNIETTKTDQEIDDEKKKQFEDASKEILNKCFERYRCLTNVNKVNGPYQSLFYYGLYQIKDKMVFASDQDISYLDAETKVAENVSANFMQSMQSIFQIYYNRTLYSLNETDLFAAIDQLNLDAKKYTLFSIGLNLQYYKQFVGNSLVIEDNVVSFKRIPIIDLGNTTNTNLNNSLIVVKNEDIPCVVHRELEEEKISKYKLTEIDSSSHIYTNIIDLYKDDNVIKNDVAQKTNIQDLSQKVLVCVDLKTEVRCKMDAKCIQLKMFSQFDDIGNPNKIEEIKNIWNNNQ